MGFAPSELQPSSETAMSEQLSLIPRARKTDPNTSKAAARRMSEASPALEAQILEVLGRYRCLTKDDIAIALGVEPRRWPSVSSACSRLRKAGKLVWTGEISDGMNVYRLADETVQVANGRL